MSSTGASALQLDLRDREFLRGDQYCAVSIAALAVHYWLLTIDEEVETFWSGRLTGATVLFVLDRYIGLLYYTFNAAQRVISMSDESCAALLPTLDISNQFLSLISVAFAFLRIFALSKKSWVLAIACFGLAMPPIVLSLLSTHGLTGATIGPGWGCAGIYEPTAFIFKEKFSLSYFALAILSVLATNGLLVYRTWIAIAPLGGIRSMHLGKGSLLQVFLRNEILYIMTMIGINIIAISGEILFYTDPTGPNFTYLNGFSDAISNILVTQFLLELQAADNRSRAGGSQLSSTDSCISSVVFDRVVGSIGCPSVTPAEDEDAIVGGDQVESERFSGRFPVEESQEDEDQENIVIT